MALQAKGPIGQRDLYREGLISAMCPGYLQMQEMRLKAECEGPCLPSKCTRETGLEEIQGAEGKPAPLHIWFCL